MARCRECNAEINSSLEQQRQTARVYLLDAEAHALEPGRRWCCSASCAAAWRERVARQAALFEDVSAAAWLRALYAVRDTSKRASAARAGWTKRRAPRAGA